MKKYLKNILPTFVISWGRIFFDVSNLLYGLLLFLLFKKRNQSSYLSFIRIFCVTRGYSNDILSYIVKVFKKPHPLQQVSGVLGTLNKSDIEAIAQEIHQKGYFKSESLLSAEMCENLLAFSLNTKVNHLIMDGKPDTSSDKILFNKDKPEATMYAFDLQDLFGCSQVQEIMADLSLLAVMQSYMKSSVYLDNVSLAWSTALKQKPDTSAAQLFHFDMERIKWLKIFIYLTDVDLDNGPHVFVEGSHRSGQIPKTFLEKNYTRLSDEEVIQAFGKEKLITFTGAKGTIIIEDTRGLHKGNHLIKGERLMLQLQYSNTLFGAVLPKAKLEVTSEKLAENFKLFPQTYSYFT